MSATASSIRSAQRNRSTSSKVWSVQRVNKKIYLMPAKHESTEDVRNRPSLLLWRGCACFWYQCQRRVKPKKINAHGSNKKYYNQLSKLTDRHNYILIIWRSPYRSYCTVCFHWLCCIMSLNLKCIGPAESLLDFDLIIKATGTWIKVKVCNVNCLLLIIPITPLDLSGKVTLVSIGRPI